MLDFSSILSKREEYYKFVLNILYVT